MELEDLAFIIICFVLVGLFIEALNK